MIPRALWIILWITLGLAQAQLLTYFSHSAGFAIGYPNDYVLQGNLLSLPRAYQLIFEPITEAGQVVLEVVSSRLNSAYAKEALKACRRGGFSCSSSSEVQVLNADQFRLEFSRAKKADTPQPWVAYAARVNGVWLVVYLEGTARVGLLEHFWRNSRFEVR